MEPETLVRIARQSRDPLIAAIIFLVVMSIMLIGARESSWFQSEKIKIVAKGEK